MPKVAIINSNWTAGEISPKLFGRVDIAKYYNGAETLLNFLPSAYGDARSRTGTIFVNESKYASKEAVLIPFQFSNEQAYMLEFGDRYIRFYKDGGIITENSKAITGISKANPAVVSSLDHGFSEGDSIYIEDVAGMTEVNGRFFTVSNVLTESFALEGIDSTGYGAYASGGEVSRIYEIATTFKDSDVKGIKFVQDADVMYLAHKNFKPKKLSRYGHTNWTIEDIDFTDGPYLPDNTTNISITPSAATGNITLTATCPAWAGTTLYHTGDFVTNGGNTYECLSQHTSSGTFSNDLVAERWVLSSLSVFKLGHVGGLWKVKDGWCQITAFSTATAVAANVIVALGISSATPIWAEGAWSDENGWPETVGFFEQRLFFGANRKRPQSAWGSVSQEYENFQDGSEDSDALNYTLASGRVNKIVWIMGSKVLGIGTSGGVSNMSGGSAADPLTPSNVIVKDETSYGSSDVQPKKIGNNIYYLQRSGRLLREFQYSFQEDAFLANNISLLSRHILIPGGIAMDYQQTPDNILWIVRSDGVLVSLTRQIDQEVAAWARHIIGGSFGSGNAVVESVACIPNDATGEDEVWLIVKRTIDGNTVRYVEYFSSIDFEGDITDAHYVDCGLIYDGAPTNHIDGLDHLEGETVTILTDGATHPDRVVQDGAIDLDVEASKVHVGLGYFSDLKTVRPEGGSAQGSSQGKIKRVYEVILRFHQTGICQIGSDFNNLDELTFRTPAMPMTRHIDLFSGDKPVLLKQGWNRAGQVCIRRNLPLPCTILAAILKIETND